MTLSDMVNLGGTARQGQPRSVLQRSCPIWRGISEIRDPALKRNEIESRMLKHDFIWINEKALRNKRRLLSEQSRRFIDVNQATFMLLMKAAYENTSAGPAPEYNFLYTGGTILMTPHPIAFREVEDTAIALNADDENAFAGTLTFFHASFCQGKAVKIKAAISRRFDDNSDQEILRAVFMRTVMTRIKDICIAKFEEAEYWNCRYGREQNGQTSFWLTKVYLKLQHANLDITPFQ